MSKKSVTLTFDGRLTGNKWKYVQKRLPRAFQQAGTSSWSGAHAESNRVPDLRFAPSIVGEGSGAEGETVNLRMNLAMHGPQP